MASTLNKILYLTLFTLYVIFYLHGQVTEFINGGTTFTRTFAKIEDGLTAPTIILCPPGAKRNVAEKYGYAPLILDIYYDINETWTKFNKTPLQVAEEMSFLLDQDFDLDISFYLAKTYPLHLGLNNHIKDGSIFVKFILTSSGLCYLIQPNYLLKKSDSPWFALKIELKPSYLLQNQPDLPVQFYFATNNTWQGIHLLSWQYLSVPKISVPFESSIETLVEIMPSLVQFQNGVNDVHQCMMDLLTKANCSQLCYSVINSLISDFGWPDCKTYEEMQCNQETGVYDPIIEADLGLCLRPAEAMIFIVQDVTSRLSVTDDNSIVVWFKYSTGQLEVKEEIPILGFATFIGSVGGSLGLFLGFSCYDYISRLIKRVTSLVQ